METETPKEMKMIDPLSSSAAGNSRINSLLIVRLSAMGDIIHTLPAVIALRRAFPHTTLGWLIEERWSELLCTQRYPRSGRAFAAASIDRSSSRGQYCGMAPFIVFVQHLGTDGRGIESHARSSVRRGD